MSHRVHKRKCDELNAEREGDFFVLFPSEADKENEAKEGMSTKLCSFQMQVSGRQKRLQKMVFFSLHI